MFVFKKDGQTKTLTSDKHKEHLLKNGWKLEGDEKPKKAEKTQKAGRPKKVEKEENGDS